MSPATATAKPALGPVQASVLYPIETAKALMGWGQRALREARRAGLKVRKVGRREYIIGRDIIEFVEQAGELVA
jgi:hypothetical protein